jgi:protocatechuate 3,4-dioxygenase beta subunit
MNVHHREDVSASGWTRHEWFGMAGGAAVASLALGTHALGVQLFYATTPAGCVASPTIEEGPYFIDDKLDRSDIRIDPTTGKMSPGIPLDLTLSVVAVGKNTCKPLTGAIVDVWHCDASGAYSEFKDPNFGDLRGKKFLRGFQTTDSSGAARFTTIYPGWYPGRAVHIHYKVRTPDGKEFTSQMFFDDKITDQVHSVAPYDRPGKRRMNVDDEIYREQGGKKSILALSSKNGGSYTAAYSIGMMV